MPRTRMSTKGQLIIPQDVRERHGWREGTELEVDDRGDVVVLRPVSSLPRTRVGEVLGILPYRGAAKTLEEMEKGIAKGARTRR
jgi:AbrB family looped-hinge helix DNA binding protein